MSKAFDNSQLVNGNTTLREAVKKVDGSGSGVDADTVDGYHATGNDYASWPFIPVVKPGGAMEVGKYVDFHLSSGGSADYDLRLEAIDQNNLLANGHKIWHSGNDGAGSGLDADKLDGIDSGRVVYGDNKNKTSKVSDINTLPSGFYDTLDAPDRFTSTWQYLINCSHTFTQDWQFQISADFHADDVRFRRKEGGVVQPWRKIWHEGDAEASLAGNGYQKLPSGIIVQWGNVGATLDANHQGTYNFPIAFPNVCFTVVAVDVGTGCIDIGITGYTTTNFTATIRTSSGVLIDPGSGIGLRFIAIGY